MTETTGSQFNAHSMELTPRAHAHACSSDPPRHPAHLFAEISRGDAAALEPEMRGRCTAHLAVMEWVGAKDLDTAVALAAVMQTRLLTVAALDQYVERRARPGRKERWLLPTKPVKAKEMKK
eukprot:gene8290-biopygen5481